MTTVGSSTVTLPSRHLSHVSSSSGSFTNRSLERFQTVSLSGLQPGAQFGILASGELDKRRDGALRGGWAKRLFILSTQCLHYFRKTDDSELFGKERGQVLLNEVAFAKMISPDKAPSGAVEPGFPSCFIAVFSKKKVLLMFLRAQTNSEAMTWVNAINIAQRTAENLKFTSVWPIQELQNYIALASVNFDPTATETSEMDSKDESFDSSSATEPIEKIPPSSTNSTTNKAPPISFLEEKVAKVLAITHSTKQLQFQQDNSKNNETSLFETIVQRPLSVGDEVEIGVLEADDTCHLVLSTGEEIVFNRSTIGYNEKALSLSPKELYLSTNPVENSEDSHSISLTRVYISVRCSQVESIESPINPTKSVVEGFSLDQGTSLSPNAPVSLFTAAFPASLGLLSMLSILISMYLDNTIVIFSKHMIVLALTYAVGIALSISQIVQFYGSYVKKENSKGAIASATRNIEPDAKSKFVLYLRLLKIENVSTAPEGFDEETETETEVGASVECSIVSENVTEGQEGSVTTVEVSLLPGVVYPIPFSPRFIAAEKGDEEKGRERWQATLAWRLENNIDTILTTPHTNFDIIKKCYPQFYHGRSRDGRPVYYEQPGKIDLPSLKKAGLTMEDLLRHYMYLTEYLWCVLEPSDSMRSITVLDVSGIGVRDLVGEVLDFIKRCSAFAGAHYPERSSKILIINISGWFGVIWNMVKPFIDPVTREKISMVKGGSAILNELETLIDIESIPSDFGGKGCKLGESQEEKDLRQHVQKFLE